MSKITVIGAGNVGATAAQRVVEKNLADTVLVDIVPGIPQGKALDIYQSAPIEGFDKKIIGTNDFSQIDGSDIVIITAGIPRKPGMSREDLLKTNAEVIISVVNHIKKYAPDSIIITVTNPLDIMTQLAQKVSGFPHNRVLGMAGILDSARFRAFIAMETKAPVSDIEAMVLGGHGDAMVPLPEYTTVKGKPISEVLPKDIVEKLIQRTRDGGAEIVAFLKTGSAFYAPSSGAVQMAESILLDQNKILPCSVYLQGQYGLNNVYIGVPAKLGKTGVKEIIELKINQEQSDALKYSADIVKENYTTALRLTSLS
ncbi:MAG: malate dehydrogenase [bacterium]